METPDCRLSDRQDGDADGMAFDFFNGDDEEVGTWEESDLVLAAELGKALLERNRDLELQVCQLNSRCQELSQEENLLGKQLQTLRSLNDGKARVLEEMDRHCCELEQQNKRLTVERHASRERIGCLTQTVEALEAKIEELKQQLKESTDSGRRRRRSRESREAPGGCGLLRRTFSFPALNSGFRGIGGNSEETPQACGCLRVLDRVADLTFQSARLKARNDDLRAELSDAVGENDGLRQEVAQLQQQLLLLKVKDASPVSSRRPPRSPLKDAEEFSEFLGSDDEENDDDEDDDDDDDEDDDLKSRIESDVVEIRGDADCGDMDDGGRVFSSSENLGRIGATRLREPKETLNEICLLTELNDQYNCLVDEYERLLTERKSKTPTESVTGDRETFERRLTALLGEESRCQRRRLVKDDYRPKYKDLFKDAMEKLKGIKESRGDSTDIQSNSLGN